MNPAISRCLLTTSSTTSFNPDAESVFIVSHDSVDVDDLAYGCINHISGNAENLNDAAGILSSNRKSSDCNSDDNPDHNSRNYISKNGCNNGDSNPFLYFHAADAQDPRLRKAPTSFFEAAPSSGNVYSAIAIDPKQSDDASRPINFNNGIKIPTKQDPCNSPPCIRDGSSFNQLAGDMSKIRKVVITDFEMIHLLGKGAFGKVYLVRKLNGSDEGKMYAMKVLKKELLNSRQNGCAQTERLLLEDIKHPFIVRLHYAFQTDRNLYLVLEYVPGGELFSYISSEKLLSEDVAIFYLAELAVAINHLHSLNVLYRDLKPENILLDQDGHIKLTDFGLSKLISVGSAAKSFCGTLEYMAPEIIMGVAYDKCVDWWSFGAVAYDMLTGLPPFQSNNKKQTMEKILKDKPFFPKYLTPDAKDILIKLLRKSPKQRLGFGPVGFADVTNHGFFKGINWHSVRMRVVPAPFIPKLSHETNVNVLDSHFTQINLEPPAKKKSFHHDGLKSVSRPSNLLESIPIAKKEFEPIDFHGFSYISSSLTKQTFSSH